MFVEDWMVCTQAPRLKVNVNYLYCPRSWWLCGLFIYYFYYFRFFCIHMWFHCRRLFLSNSCSKPKRKMFSFFYACSLGLLELKNYRKHGGTLPVPSGCAFHFSIYLCHYFVGHYNLNKTCLKPRHQTTTGHEHGPKIDEVYIFPFTCATGHC